MGMISWKCFHCGLILQKWTPLCPSCDNKLKAIPGSTGVTEEELLLAGFKV